MRQIARRAPVPVPHRRRLNSARSYTVNSLFIQPRTRITLF